MVHKYNGTLLSNENVQNNVFAVTWMDLEIVIPSEVSQINANIM